MDQRLSPGDLTTLKDKHRKTTWKYDEAYSSLHENDLDDAKTMTSMAVSLESIKKDHTDQVPNDQIVSAKLEDLTTSVQDCMSNLDKQALDSTAVYGDQAEYADKTTTGDNTESGGDL